MKRRPPTNNVRLVATNGSTNRGNFVNRFGELVQTESALEYAWVLETDRKPNITGYTSQPEKVHYIDQFGKARVHYPDFRVFYVGGLSEVHDVTVAERLAKNPILQDQFAQMKRICDARGEGYVVSTDKNLPSGTKLLNLRVMLAFRPSIYFIGEVVDKFYEMLDAEEAVLFDRAISDLGGQLKAPKSDVFGCLMHMLWHGRIETDLTKRILDRGEVVKGVRLSLPKDAPNGY